MRHLILFFLCSIFTIQLSAQCIAGDCQNGKGTYVFPSGAKYTGAFKDGEIHGVGVCYYTNGSKYSGQWLHRYPEGKGTKTFADGTKRTGDWLKGQPVDEHGEIIEFTAKGETEDDDGTDIQTGCVSGDCENGKGVFAYADGSRYEGKFLKGKLHGFGSLFSASGDKFVGSFENNFQNGSGTMFHADGTKSVGQWLEGEFHGDTFREMGIEGCQQGDCENGQGTYIYKDGEAKYVGNFKDGLANGAGTCFYSNGERYEGDWEAGMFQGTGTLYMLDGTQVAGNWKEGTYMGKETAVDLAIAKKEEVAEESIDRLAVKEAKTMKVWAVIIGVADYSHMPALKYTDDDAYRVYSFLKSPAGGALKDEQIRILIDENATKDKITNALTEVFGKAGENDLVMMYYSGHGLKGSFLPIDFDGFNNKLGHDEVSRILKSSKAKYKVCIADACHSGSLLAMKSGTVDNLLATYYTSLAKADSGTALIMSSKSSETSLESSGLRQGVFSHFLQRGMKGEADTDGNKIVSISELFGYISENVRTYTGYRQSPVIQGDYDPTMTVGVVRED